MSATAQNIMITPEEREQRAAQVNNLVEQANRAVIETDQHMEKGADLVKILKAHRKKLDEKRRSFTDPLKLTAKNIKAEFDESTDLIDAAVIAVTKLMSNYLAEKNRLAEIERKRLIKVAEDEAQAEADKTQRLAAEAAKRLQDDAAQAAADAEASGDTATAQAVTEAAEEKVAEIIEQGNKVAEQVIDNAVEASTIAKHTNTSQKHTGDFGATVHARRNRTWKAKSLHAVPERFLLLNDTEVKMAVREHKMRAETDAFARGLKGKEFDVHVAEELGKFEIPGIEFSFEVSAAIR